MAEKTPIKRTSAATCVCRTCNGSIISKKHPLDLFGEKAIKEGIGWDLGIFSRVKFSLDAGFPSREQESIIRSKRGKTVQESPSSTTSPGVGREKKRSKVSWLELMLRRIFFIN